MAWRGDLIGSRDQVAECLAHLATTENAFYGENARVLGEVLFKHSSLKISDGYTWMTVEGVLYTLEGVLDTPG